MDEDMKGEMEEAAAEAAVDAVEEATVAEALHEDAIEKAADAVALERRRKNWPPRPSWKRPSPRTSLGDAVADAELASRYLAEAAEEEDD